jgi:hypothetical protein
MEDNTSITRIDAEKALVALRESVAEDQITIDQFRQLRNTLGIANSIFTKKQLSSKQRKIKNKAQKLARRQNRGPVKGQRQFGGIR